MEYLKLFETTTQYDNYLNGVMHLPNVSYNEDTKKVMFNPKPKRILKYNATDDNLLCFGNACNFKSVRIDEGENLIKNNNYRTRTITVNKNDYFYDSTNDKITPINPSVTTDIMFSYIESIKIMCDEPILDSDYLLFSGCFYYYGVETVASFVPISSLFENEFNEPYFKFKRISEKEILLTSTFGFLTEIGTISYSISKSESIDDIIPTTISYTGVLNDEIIDFTVNTTDISSDKTSFTPKCSTYYPINITLTTPNHQLSSDDLFGIGVSVGAQEGIEPLGSLSSLNATIIDDNTVSIPNLSLMLYETSSQLVLEFKLFLIMDSNGNPLETNVKLKYCSNAILPIFFETSGEHDVTFETYVPSYLDSNIFYFNGNYASITHANNDALKYIKICPDSLLQNHTLQEITIPSSMTSLDYSTIYRGKNTSALNKIVVDENNPIYDSRDNCNAIISTSTNKLIMASNSTTTIPSSVTSLGNYAFSFCQIDEITIPSGITSLGDEHTFFASAISKITFEENSQVTKIPNDCFANCKNLSEFIIPKHITKLGSRIIRDTNCQKIICEPTTPPTLSFATFGSLPETGTLYVPKGSDYSSWLGDYDLGSGWTIVETEN